MTNIFSIELCPTQLPQGAARPPPHRPPQSPPPLQRRGQRGHGGHIAAQRERQQQRGSISIAHYYRLISEEAIKIPCIEEVIDDCISRYITSFKHCPLAVTLIHNLQGGLTIKAPTEERRAQVQDQNEVSSFKKFLYLDLSHDSRRGCERYRRRVNFVTLALRGRFA